MPESAMVLEDEPLPGIAELVESRPEDDPQSLAEALMERDEQVGVAAPAARGPARYLSIVDRIRGRRLLTDLGVQPFTVNWFSFHVPPSARGRLRIAHRTATAGDVNLKVLGLGFGSGRAVSLALEEDYGEREECLLLRRTFEAHFRAFEDRTGYPYIQVDVQRVLRDEQVSQGRCDRCAVGQLPPLDFIPVPGVAIDLRSDRGGRTIADTVKIEENREIEMSLPIRFANLDVTPGVALKRQLELECSYGYTLPGGHCYTPYRDASGWQDFPFWLRT